MCIRDRGYSAAMRIESICTVPMAAVGNAMSSYTAQNIGAGEYSLSLIHI